MTDKIDPGPGYRLLEVGEVHPDGYEWLDCGAWKPGEYPGRMIRIGDYPCRVKLPAAADTPKHDTTKGDSVSIEQILAERQKTHGKYSEHAKITQSIKCIMDSRDGWGRLTVSQRETLHMIAHKVGRVLAGDPNVRDHWDDIAGYATLISREIDEAKS